MSVSASYLKSFAAFLNCKVEEWTARLFYFIISDHDTDYLTYTLYHFTTPLPVACTDMGIKKKAKEEEEEEEAGMQ